LSSFFTEKRGAGFLFDVFDLKFGVFDLKPIEASSFLLASHGKQYIFL
jgi:hypothetical protein